ncbi:MAG: hypothetical protein NT144_12850, partial [Bacteroidia bacterium]|nr:hypothetical protein [Bacteroidia bacterium]
INNLDYPYDLIKPLFLEDNIIEEIRNDIITGFKNSRRVKIIKNWELQPSLNLDFIFSRAVMEHVTTPGSIYKCVSNQLKVDSFMFHDIEFHSHGLTKKK